MQQIETRRIRNVALVGHGGSGKTTLAEAMIYLAGVTKRQGSVDNGTSELDREHEAQQRRSSVSLGLVSFDWTASDGNAYRINLLDTPGHPDFEAEVDAALSVCDVAVIVVSAADGVEVGTEQAWRSCAQRRVPCLFFVTKEDKHRADFESVLAALRQRFGAGITPIELPLGEEDSFHGVADVLSEQAHEYEQDGRHHVEQLPAEMLAREHAVHDAVVEEIVSGDDAQLERYLEGELPTTAELERTLARELLERSEFPVLVGSGLRAIGVDRLADYLCEIGPSPADRPVSVTAGDRRIEVAADPAGPPLVVVFKTVSDQYVGQVSLFKVISGTLVPDITLRVVATGGDERLHTLTRVRGSEQIQVGRLVAGELGAVTKLSTASTGSTLSLANQPVLVDRPSLPDAHLGLALVPNTQSDDDKLSEALHRLVAEDPALRVGYDPLARRTVLYGVGDAHLAVALSRLERRHGVRVSTDGVRVDYRQTLAGPIDLEGRVKKQSGGHGQFAVVSLRIRPIERGAGLDFVDAVVGGAIPKQYVAAVRHGIEEAMASGAGSGIPIVDLRVECYDGKTHSVDSSDMAFKTAAAGALSDAVTRAGSVLLEPISLVELRVPIDHQGEVLGDLSARRGRIMASEADGDGTQRIAAEVPASELARYAMDLRAITGGRGRYTVAEGHYAALPDTMVKSVVAAYARH